MDTVYAVITVFTLAFAFMVTVETAGKLALAAYKRVYRHKLESQLLKATRNNPQLKAYNADCEILKNTIRGMSIAQLEKVIRLL